MPKVKIFSAFVLPDDPGITFEKPSLTQQQHLDDCDVNTIMNRFRITGQLKQAVGQFEYLDNYADGDFTYHDAMNFIRNSEQEFMALPSSLRARFENDPGKLMTFLHSDRPEDMTEAVNLGFRQAPEQPTLDVTVPSDSPDVTTPPGTEQKPDPSGKE